MMDETSPERTGTYWNSYLGKVPAYSVVVPGSIKTKDNLSLYCAVIVKTVDEQTRSKTSINELLRD